MTTQEHRCLGCDQIVFGYDPKDSSNRCERCKDEPFCFECLSGFEDMRLCQGCINELTSEGGPR